MGGIGSGRGGSSIGRGRCGSCRIGGLPGGDGFPGWPPIIKLRVDEAFDNERPPGTTRQQPGCQAGVPMKLRFALGSFPGRNLGLSARLPMPSGRQLGIRRWCHAINHPPAWL